MKWMGTLRPAEQRVAQRILDRQRNSGWCDDSIAKLADDSGCSESTALSAVKRLTRLGVLETHPGTAGGKFGGRPATRKRITGTQVSKEPCVDERVADCLERAAAQLERLNRGLIEAIGVARSAARETREPKVIAGTEDMLARIARECGLEEL